MDLTGRKEQYSLYSVQSPESLGSSAETDTGHDVSVPGPVVSLPEVVIEADTGHGSRPGAVSTQSDLGLSVGATLENNNPVLGRSRRNVKPVDQLVVGNPTGWHFNRTKPRR